VEDLGMACVFGVGENRQVNAEMRFVPHQLKRRNQFSRGFAGVLLIGLFGCAVATGQTKYQFDHWTTDEGLPQNAVNAIVQTRDGYLWLATFDGLVRFDGSQFTVFNKSNTRGIGSNRLAWLYEDRHGTLWSVTDEDWLVKYQAGVFTTYTPKEGLPSWAIQQIEEDEAGNFQIVLREGVAKWKDGRFITYTLEELLPASAGAKWVGGNRLAWLAAGNLYWYAHGRLNTYSTASGLPTLNIISVFEDQHRTVWINTWDAGLVRVEDGRFTAYAVNAPPRDVAVPAQEDRKGNIWLVWGNEWLGKLKDARLTRYPASYGFLVFANTSFYEDREGNFWIGAANGLYRAREAAITVLTHQNGLSSDNVYSIYEDRAGNLWFGTWGSGVTKYEDGRFTHYRIKDGLTSEVITTLYEDRDGYMWIGTTFGLHRFKDGRLSKYPDPDGLFGDGAWAIHQDRSGRFWFGTSKGLIKYEGGRYTRYTTADGLAGDDVKAILEDRTGRLWFGTWGGLSTYDDGRFTSYTEQYGLASDHIRTLHEDAEGILWVGTYDGGLSRFKDGRFTRYTTKEGLFNNGVFQILEDEHGYFWMSSNKGIYRVKRQELNDFADGKLRSITSIAYGKNDGLLNVECNGGRQPAGWKTRDGRLWFPTARGAAVIDPREINENTTPPPVVIEEVRIAGEPVALSESVNVPPDKRSFDIEYVGLSFIKPEQVKYNYKLEGLDNDWVDAGTRRVAYYNHVPHGEFTFTVIAANSDGVWNQTGQSIRIKVFPYWWEIRWVQVLMLLGAMMVSSSAAVLLYKYKNVLLGRERNRIAGDLHDEPKQHLFAIRSNAWRIQSELNSIRKDFKSAGTEKIDLAAALAQEIFLYAKEASAEMSSIIEDLRLQPTKEFKLTAAIEDLIAAKSKQLPSINFARAIDSIDGMFDDKVEFNIYRILRESINNIVRHSHATNASVTIKRDEHTIVIIIEDNGTGFAVEELQSVSDTGIGLRLIQERAQIIGGAVVINSVPGRGTKITVKLNRNQRHRDNNT
jgi:ligand-binding sensor domain-containing protein/signal transduction histidine kinase